MRRVAKSGGTLSAPQVGQVLEAIRRWRWNANVRAHLLQGRTGYRFEPVGQVRERFPAAWHALIRHPGLLYTVQSLIWVACRSPCQRRRNALGLKIMLADGVKLTITCWRRIAEDVIAIIRAARTRRGLHLSPKVVNRRCIVLAVLVVVNVGAGVGIDSLGRFLCACNPARGPSLPCLGRLGRSCRSTRSLLLRFGFLFWIRLLCALS